MRRNHPLFFTCLITTLASITISGCSTKGLLPDALTRDAISPTKRQGQLSVSIFTNTAPDQKSANWPFLLVKSAVSNRRFVIRSQPGPVIQSQYFSDRIAPGRYRLLGLMKDRFTSEQIEPLPQHLGMFDISAGQHLDLGLVVHWRGEKTLSSRNADHASWVSGTTNNSQKAAKDIRRQLAPPARLLPKLVARPLATVSRKKGINWQRVSAESLSPLSQAIMLDDGRVFAIGEQQTIFVSNASGDQLLPVRTNLEGMLALLDCKVVGEKLVLLASTASEMVILESPLSTLANNLAPSLTFTGLSRSERNKGWQHYRPSELRWSMTTQSVNVTTLSGRKVFSANF